MAAVPICSNMFHKYPTKTKQGALFFFRTKKPMQFQAITEVLQPYRVCCMGTPLDSDSENVSETRTNMQQLKTLDSYFSKCDKEVNKRQNSSISRGDNGNGIGTEDCQKSSSSQLPGNMMKELDRNDNLTSKTGLGSVESYLSKLKTVDEGIIKSKQIRLPYSDSGEHEEKSEDRIDKLNIYMSVESMNDENEPLFAGKNYHDLPYDESSDFTLISLLSSINIGVFIFEIASPIRNSDFEQLSLPLVYGAKINQLIIDGEWWRLVTPMFLHSGFFHVALGCWVLLTFGPQVCRGYGSLTFLLIYILGGISGNLSSFLHTTELTVGGTGPVFAILGAWFIFQIQNKKMISEQESQNMFQKALITTFFTFILSNFEHVDDWTHLGAIFAGLVYGFLTCPTVQLGNASSRNVQEDGIALVRFQPGPCRSLFLFSVFLLILVSFFFLLEPQLKTLELGSFVL